MQSAPGYLFKDFDTQASFEGPCKYAEDIDVLVWKDEKERMFFARRYEDLVEYMRKVARNDEGLRRESLIGPGTIWR